MAVDLNYLTLDPESRKKLSETLRIKVQGKDIRTGKNIIIKSFNFFSVVDPAAGIIRIPKALGTGCAQVSASSYKAWPKNLCPRASDFSLRADQAKVFETTKNRLSLTGGAILSVPPGFGKTLLGLLLAHHFGLKTAVIVPRKVLVNQWKETLKRFFSGEGADEVVIVMDTQVVSTVQEELRRSIGFLIIDEGHMLSTISRVDALLYFTPKYVLVETATLPRDDTAHVMMELVAGRNEEGSEKISRQAYTVTLLETGILFPEVKNKVTGKLDYSKLKTEISNCEKSNLLIVDQIVPKRTLVLTPLVSHAQKLAVLCRERRNLKAAVLVSNATKLEHEDFDVLIGTTSKVGVGFDISTFSSLSRDIDLRILILTHTVKKWQSFEQFRGRVMRSQGESEIIFILPRNSIFARHIKQLKPWILETNGSIKIKKQ